MNAASAVKAADRHPDARRRVLIVDDDRDFADGLASALEMSGYTVEAVYDAVRAAERCRAFAPAIAVVDIHLGTTSGLDLASRLRSDRSGLLCIMMTAYAELDSAIKAVQEGAYDYLRKPLHNGELLAALDRGFEVLRLRRDKEAADVTAEQEHVRLIEAIESISEGFVLYDSDERFVLCNSRYKDFYPQIADDLVPGAKLEDVARKAFENGAVLEAVGNVEEWMRIRLDQHRSASGSHEQHLSDGRWLLCSERRTRDGQTVGIRTDITELKRREQALRASEERYAGLFEDSPVGIWEEDFSGVKAYLDELPNDEIEDFEAYLDRHPEVVEECVKRVRIVDVNLAGLRLLDAPDKKTFLAGLPLVFTAEAYDRFKHELVEIRKGVTSFEHETEVRTLAGDIRNLAVRWAVAPGAEETYARVFLTTIDVTDRKRAEEALRKSEASLANAQRIARLGNWDWDAVADELHWSDEIYRIFGLRRQEFGATHDAFLDCVHPDDRDRVRRTIETSLEHGQSYDMDYTIFRSDGENRTIHEHAEVSLDGGGQIARMSGTLQDVTESRRAEYALRESERRLRAIIDNAPSVILLKDGQGRYLTVNKEFQRLYGISEEEARGKLVDEILPTAEGARISKEHDEAVLKSGEAVEIEERIPFADGERVFRTVKFPIPDESGEITGIGSIETDITERKVAEEALRESEERFRAVFEQAAVGIGLMTPGGRFLSVNDKLCDIMRRERHEMLAIRFHEFTHPDDYRTCVELIARLIGGEISTFTTEMRYLRKDGELLWGNLTVSILRQGDSDRFALLGVVEDITERRRAEDMVRESEERFRTVVDNSPSALLFKGLDGRFQIVSRRFQEWFGPADEDMIGMTTYDIVPREQADRLKAGDEVVLKTMTAAEEEHDLRFNDGTLHTVSVTRFPVVDRDGRAIGVTSITTDVTARKRAEEELRRSEERHRLAIEGANDGVWEWDVGSDCIYASGRAFEILGIERPGDDCILVADWVDHIHPHDAGKYGDALRAHLKGESEFFALEYRALFGDGTYHWIAHRGQALRDADGRARRMAGSYSDITERKRAEEELRESEERFRSIVDNSPSAIFLKDLDGRYRVVSKRFEEWYGVSSAEAVGKTTHDIFSPEPADRDVALDREVLETGEVREREFTVPFADGSLRALVATKFPVLGTDGRSIGVGTINTDITGQRKAEEQLQQAQKMEAVGQLTGGVAHDFNNLLTVILGNIALLEDEVEDERLRLFAAAAKGAAERGAELTDQLLAFSRKQTLDAKPVDLGELVSGMSRILRRTLGDNIQIETATAGDLSRTRADPAQLENALLNLAINARDAMPDGGKLNIEAANASADRNDLADNPEAAPDDFVVLSVSDNGHGMEPEVLAHVFEPFFTTKEVGEGSGLGLSMVYGFVKQSGGYVEIDSEPGRGTSVRVYLPKALESDAAVEDVSHEELEPRGQGETVLVVEDDSAVRTLTVNILTSLGYRAIEAGNGESALVVLDERPEIDLLLSDFMLPGGMNGAEIVREAALRRPDLKVLLMSGYAAARTARERGLDGDAEMIRKPYQKAALARRLRSLLEG